MRQIRYFFKNIYDFIIPQIPECVYCGTNKNLIDDYVCEECEIIKEKLKIEKENHEFLSCYYYDDIIKKVIWNYKYNYNGYLADYIANEILKIFDKNALEADFITNVPLHRKKKRKRGFDQAKEICLCIEKKTGIPYKPLLMRIRNTKAQAYLSMSERKQNVKNAFKINNKEKIRNKSVIIIDDVLTTGSTIKSCSEEMIKQGIKNTIPITFAKTRMPKN